MSNQNERVAAAPFQEAVESPAQRILWERLRTYDHSFPLSDYSPETLFSSDLQTLEHEFRRFGVSELDRGDQGMTDRVNWFPSDSQQNTGREQRNQSEIER
ncbi:hypothetical protein ISN44_As04g008090 [Arabidopsis suecica]|uniref:Uncharacterized protein n=1 Tax=Arabidopsis suecica TaxID=45249 RepID=A0A8T2ECU6_ARASU|nr:hypothetical protein ISN44_As04g008090 [Arabidopsis suecica]